MWRAGRGEITCSSSTTPAPNTSTTPRGGPGMEEVALVGGPVAVRGAAELEPTRDGLRIHRLPAAARAKLPDDFIGMCELQAAGVRLLLRTAATRLELDVRALRTVSVNRPPDGSDGPLPDAGRYDVVVDGVVVGSAGAHAHGTIR